jgi:hypothetical protein
VHAWFPPATTDKALTVDTVVTHVLSGAYRVSLPMVAWCDTVVRAHAPSRQGGHHVPCPPATPCAAPRRTPAPLCCAALRCAALRRPPPAVAQLNVVSHGKAISAVDKDNEAHYKARVDTVIKAYMVTLGLPTALVQPVSPTAAGAGAGAAAV